MNHPKGSTTQRLENEELEVTVDHFKEMVGAIRGFSDASLRKSAGYRPVDSARFFRCKRRKWTSSSQDIDG